MPTKPLKPAARATDPDLTAEQREQISRFVPVYQQYEESIDYQRDMAEQQARIERFAGLLSPDGLDRMTEQEFGQVISALWASRMWSNKSYYVEQLLEDNGLAKLRAGLLALLWGEDTLANRYDQFRRAIKGLGAASITEILAFVHPMQCALWNDRTRKALDLLGFSETFPALRKSQITGPRYEAYLALIGAIRDQLAQSGLRWFEPLDVNYFLFEVWRLHRDSLDYLPEDGDNPLNVLVAGVMSGGLASGKASGAPSVYEFDHNEVVDQIVAIGQWLGFQAEKERRVARGAQVDAIWQARIANLGVITYVFEIQRHGSIDSLILNLQRAANNPTVQRLIVVANYVDIEAVKREIAGLPEHFRNLVTYMEVSEAIRAARLIDELSGIIGKLDLVRSEFGV